MKYAVKVKHRGQVLAKIYKPGQGYSSYRVAWKSASRRIMKAFPRYSAAKRHADSIAKDLAAGGQLSALTASQATDAITALRCLQRFYEDTGSRISLPEVVKAHRSSPLAGCEMVTKLN